jgi:hypothetical protein
MQDDNKRKHQPGTLGMADALRRELEIEESGYLGVVARATAEAHEDRYTNPGERYWQYRAKPVRISLVFGAFAVLLIVGQLWLEDLAQALGGPLPYIGWWRLLAFIAGAYCAFIAWPRYVHITGNRRIPPRLNRRR